MGSVSPPPPVMCDSAGNRGFILDVGSQIDSANDIQLSNPLLVYSFGTTNTADRMDISTGFISSQTNNSLLYNNVQYEYIGLQFAKAGPAQIPVPGMGQPAATSKLGEVIMTFKKKGAIAQGERYITTRFPIFSKSLVSENTFVESPRVAKYLRDVYTNAATNKFVINGDGLRILFEDGITAREGNMAIEYVTCIEIEGESDRTSIRGILFPGHVVDLGQYEQTIRDLLVNPRIPSPITGNRRTVRKYAGEETNTNTSWQSSSEFVPRIFLNTLSAANITRMTTKPLSSGSSSLSKKTTQEMQKYKCLPIDVMKDVDGDRLVIDPTTGGEALGTVAESERNQLTAVLPGANPGKLNRTIDFVGTLLIVILSAALVFVIFMYIYKFKLWHRTAEAVATAT
jgi:hypothetical protein